MLLFFLNILGQLRPSSSKCSPTSIIDAIYYNSYLSSNSEIYFLPNFNILFYLIFFEKSSILYYIGYRLFYYISIICRICQTLSINIANIIHCQELTVRQPLTYGEIQLEFEYKVFFINRQKYPFTTKQKHIYFWISSKNLTKYLMNITHPIHLIPFLFVIFYIRLMFLNFFVIFFEHFVNRGFLNYAHNSV